MASDLKSTVSKILYKGFKSRGANITKSGDRFWDIKKAINGVALVDLKKNVNPPASYLHLRGVIVDTKTHKIVSFGFGYPEHAGPESAGLIKDDPNIVIRPGVEGIIVRMFMLRGVLYFATYKNMGVSGDLDMHLMKYEHEFNRILKTKYKTQFYSFTEATFPRETCNYSHTFHLVTEDFLKTSSLPVEDIYLVDTEVFGPGKVTYPDVSRKQILSAEEATNYFNGVVGERGEPTEWTGSHYKSNLMPSQLANFLVLEMYRPYRGRRVLDRTIELYPQAYMQRDAILSSQGNLYASYIHNAKRMLESSEGGKIFIDILADAQDEMLNAVNPLHADEVKQFALMALADSEMIFDFSQDWKATLKNLAEFQDINFNKATKMFNERSTRDLETVKSFRGNKQELLKILSSSSFYYLASRIRRYDEFMEDMDAMLDNILPDGPDAESLHQRLRGRAFVKNFEDWKLEQEKKVEE